MPMVEFGIAYSESGQFEPKELFVFASDYLKGDEAMCRVVMERLSAEGVNVAGVFVYHKPPLTNADALVEPLLLSRDKLASIVTKVQGLMYYEPEDKVLDPEKEWDEDTLERIAEVLEAEGLVPDEPTACPNE